MRLSEKTLELNICNQWPLLPPWPHMMPFLWFGLTQRQEAQAGFDVCTKVGGRLLILQIKASNQIIRGLRRFHVPHAQFEALSQRVRPHRSIFYVFPDLGTTAELAKQPSLLPNLWLLDVATIVPPLPPPITRKGTPRKNGIHYADLHVAHIPPVVVFHSEPRPLALFPFKELFVPQRELPLGARYESFQDLAVLRRAFARHCVAGIIPSGV